MSQTVVINPGAGLQVNKAAEPSSASVNWDVPMTQLAEGFAQMMDAFVATRVMPMLTVDRESGFFWRYPIGTFARHEMTDRGEMTRAARANYELAREQYYCDFKALGHDISDRRKANSRSPIDWRMSTTKFLTEQALIDLEKSFVDNHFKAGIWDFQVTGAASSSITDLKRATGNTMAFWNNYTGSNPIINITDAQTAVHQATGRRPNVLSMGRQVWDKLRHHPDFVGRIDDGQTRGVAKVAKMNMADLLELEAVEVMDSVENSANEGQAADMKFLGGKNALLSYRSTPSPNAEDGSAGYSFVYRSGDLIPNAVGMFNSTGMGISSYYDIEKRCTAMEIDLAYDMKRSSEELAIFFSGIVE